MARDQLARAGGPFVDCASLALGSSAYWPTSVVVDRRGVVRYYHIGEGAYQECEAVIQRLSAEAK